MTPTTEESIPPQVRTSLTLGKNSFLTSKCDHRSDLEWSIAYTPILTSLFQFPHLQNMASISSQSH